MTDGRVYLWGRNGDDDFSPYVDESLIEASIEKGKPAFLKPRFFDLKEDHPYIDVEFEVLEDQQFRLIQEIENPRDTKIKARITRYGKAAISLRRNVRDAIGSARRLYDALFKARQ